MVHKLIWKKWLNMHSFKIIFHKVRSWNHKQQVVETYLLNYIGMQPKFI